MPKVTVQDLFARIGQLTMENEALRQENETLINAMAGIMGEPAPDTGDEDVPSEVPSAVSGPDDNSGLV
jgi:hypothetical protein